MSKKPFNTPVDEELAKKVRKKCKENNIKITDLVEGLFSLYINDELEIEKKTTYTIKRKGGK